MNYPNPPHLPITVISAGAGSGKTYTLTGRMLEMLEKGVRPSAIIATTFTKKAAAELQERVRARLLEKGQSEAANELGSALIGTVHSIGTKLLQRFAFEAGVSPLVEVIADGDEQRLFNESLTQILTNERTDRMNELADRLGLTKKTYGESFDWRSAIRQITDVARANNFSEATLEKSRQKSWASFAAMLPPATATDEITWNNRLIAALQQTVAALDDNEVDTTKTTRDATEQLRQIEHTLKWRGELYWHEWVKIAKINPGAKSRDLMEDLRALALSHDEHRGFQADVKGYIDLVFEIAAGALAEFEQYKQKRGLIDYTDMETYVSKLLHIPSVRETLRNEVDLLLVDEFQDTSPIQLDIFLQLSRIAKHSIWVGDPKQSIYGFRGAEPALMQAIIEATGGVSEENILKDSWRSRPDLVEAVNAVFTKAFDTMPPAQIVLNPAFSKQKETEFWKKNNVDPLDNHAALLHWNFVNEEDQRKVPGQPWMEDCIAAQVRVLLEQGIPIFDKKRETIRPVRPGDIAVICRKNYGCETMAGALHRAGLKAGVARSGLLSTPEIKIALAYLKRLVNPYDRLSAAEIKLISGDTTLEVLLRQITTADPSRKWESLEIPAPGSDLHLRSAAEALDLLIAETDLRRKIVRLGNAVQRLDNLEVLCRYATDYESACTRLHSAATISGFLLWLHSLAENGKDFQGSGESPDTVNILTYHRSKGLEYPVCICHNLDQVLQEKVWGINLVPEAPPDLDDILGGRWLRFWVNPYADQIRGSRLETRLLESEAYAVANRQALDEEARLLYVGLTRARDYLVFPTTSKPTKWLNRVFNHGNEDIPTLDPNTDETPFLSRDGSVIYAATAMIFQPRNFGEMEITEPPFPFHQLHAGKQNHYPFRIQPASEAAPGNVVAPTMALEEITPALTWQGEYDIQIDKSLNALLFSGLNPGVPNEVLQLARRQLEVRNLTQQLRAEVLAGHYTLLMNALQQKFGAGSIQRAVPIRLPVGNRILEHTIDLLLSTKDNEWIILQTAPFCEQKSVLKTQFQQMSSTMLWLREAFTKINPTAVIQLWIIAPVNGVMAALNVE